MNTPSSSTETDPAPHPESTSWLKRLGIGMLVIVVPLAAAILYRQRVVADRLQLALDELDRTDPGWRLPGIEAARREVPDRENSALYIKEAVGRLPKGWPPQELGDRLKGTPPELLAPADLTYLQDELKPLTPALEVARKLADLPYGRFDIVYKHNPLATLLPDQQETRRAAILLAYDVRRLAQAGDLKEAMHSCRAGLNAARALGDEPFLVSQLIRIACTTQACKSIEWTLALGEPDPKDLEQLQRALEDEDHTNTLVLALRGERAALHQVFVIIENGEVDLSHFFRDMGQGESFQDRFLPWKTRYDALSEHPLLLSLMNERIETAQKPLHEQAAADRDFGAKVRELAGSTRLIRILMPAVEKVSEAFRRDHAGLRCQIALVAAERYRRAEGHWPVFLEQLRPRFLAEVPLDPYDGKPLRYKRLADGVVAYSVGPDGTDDGGALARDNPMKAGTDLGYRLWDAPQRRQPPRPKPPALVPGGPGR